MLARHDRQPALPLFLLKGSSLSSGELERPQMSRDGLWKMKAIGCEARVYEVLVNKIGVYIFLKLTRSMIVGFVLLNMDNMGLPNEHLYLANRPMTLPAEIFYFL